MNIICIASYEKGHEFMRECARQGANVILLTSASLEHKVQWPTESIGEIFYMPDDRKVWNKMHTLYGLSYLARTRAIDRIVPLDDFDLEMASFLREHLRVPGMGETTTRYFRDKLAMRMRAEEAGIKVPRFQHVLHHGRVNEFLSTVPGPWVLKPRSSAGAIGIKKCHSAQEAWDQINALGDEQSFYLLEEFIPGEVCHVDSIMIERQLRYALASQYGRPPLEVSHDGGIFLTSLVERGSELERKLQETNRRVLAALGLLRGVSHSEYIISRETGEVYFLETSARVGGAHIADLIEAATGINMWREWAKIEIGGRAPYELPAAREDYAGLLVSLARQEHPDLSILQDPEVVWRMEKKHHAGVIVASPSLNRVRELLTKYTDVVSERFHAVAPPRSRPAD
jgi:hypothetical protein